MINTERILEIGMELRDVEKALNRFDRIGDCNICKGSHVDDYITCWLSVGIGLWKEYFELTKKQYSLTCGTVH